MTKVERAHRLGMALGKLWDRRRPSFAVMLKFWSAMDEAVPELLAGAEAERLVGLRWLAQRDQTSARVLAKLQQMYPDSPD